MKKQTTEKNLEYYMSLPYTIELTPDEDGFWFANIRLLKGCMTNGTDAADAVEMILDAKRGWLITALELGLAIPEPESDEAPESDIGLEKSNIRADSISSTATRSIESTSSTLARKQGPGIKWLSIESSESRGETAEIKEIA